MSSKNIRLQARVTKNEYEKIMKMAKNSGYKNLSKYLRNKVVNKEIVEFDFGNINERLAKVGKNLNHLVMLCHQGKIDRVDLTGYGLEIESLLEDLKDKLL